MKKTPKEAVGRLSIWRLMQEASSEWRHLSSGGLCLIGGTACGLMTPKLFGDIIDAVTTQSGDERVATVQHNCIGLVGRL